MVVGIFAALAIVETIDLGAPVTAALSAFQGTARLSGLDTREPTVACAICTRVTTVQVRRKNTENGTEMRSETEGLARGARCGFSA